MAKDNELKLDRTPTSAEEAKFDFASPDERADRRNKNHEIDVLKLNQGWLGRMIGSSSTPLTIIFFMVVIGAVTLLVSVAGVLFFAFESSYSVLEYVFPFLSLLAGYVMGKDMR